MGAAGVAEPDPDEPIGGLAASRDLPVPRPNNSPQNTPIDSPADTTMGTTLDIARTAGGPAGGCIEYGFIAGPQGAVAPGQSEPTTTTPPMSDWTHGATSTLARLARNIGR